LKDKIEKERGIFVRNKLKELLLNKIINIYCSDKNEDKYGRLLIEFNVPNTNIKIHDWLINNNYAIKYEGKTKKKWNTELWYKYSSII
jgi:endonuclease YncB( thermonuclease family)